MSVNFVPESSYKIVFDEDQLRRAAEKLQSSSALVIMAGAGMGVESGILTYRTNEDFWIAHPQLRDKKLGIPEMSNSLLFHKDPHLAWGFVASRLHNYRKKFPHEGYHILKKWTENMDSGYFVFTSNVDSHFLRAGFRKDRIVERHGSLEYLQLLDIENGDHIWRTPSDFNIQWNPDTLRAYHPLPTVCVPNTKDSISPLKEFCVNEINSKSDTEKRLKKGNGLIVHLDECRQCGKLKHPIRPNMRLFNDDTWINQHILSMEERFHAFIRQLVSTQKQFVVLEIGVGVTVDTVRPTTDRIAKEWHQHCTLIRINPIEADVNEDSDHISLCMTGLSALKEIDKLLRS